MFGKTTVPAGEYSLFIDLKLPEWTLIISSWARSRSSIPGHDRVWAPTATRPTRTSRACR